MSAAVQREGVEAVFDQDATRLKAAIEAGFRLEEFQHLSVDARRMPGARSESPMSPFLRTIKLGWFEGWSLLLNAFPEHAHRAEGQDFPILWEAALHKARRGMLQDLFQLGVDPQHRDDGGRSSLHVLFEAVREGSIDRPNPVELIQCIKWLVGKGLDVFEPHPGEFHLGDIYKEGHTFWTYAVSQDAWTAAMELMPRRWEDVVRTPRWKSTLQYFHQRCMAGRIRPDIAYEMWGQFLSRFLEPWMAHSGETFTELGHMPWIANMCPESRQKVWALWSKPDGTGRTGWHRVAQHAHAPWLATVLDLARQDGVALPVVWSHAEKFGERPMDAWAYALLGSTSPLRANFWQIHYDLWKSLPVQACALVDEIHDPCVNDILKDVAQAWSNVSPRHKSLHEGELLRNQLAAFKVGMDKAPRKRL